MPATFAAPVQGDVRIRFGDAGNALAGLHRGVERGARCAAAGLVILAYARVEQCVGEFQLPTLGKLGRQPRLCTLTTGAAGEIGRAAGRDRVCQYVEVSVGAVQLKKDKGSTT